MVNKDCSFSTGFYLGLSATYSVGMTSLYGHVAAEIGDVDK